MHSAKPSRVSGIICSSVWLCVKKAVGEAGGAFGVPRCLPFSCRLPAGRGASLGFLRQLLGWVGHVLGANRLHVDHPQVLGCSVIQAPALCSVVLSF